MNTDPKKEEAPVTTASPHETRLEATENNPLQAPGQAPVQSIRFNREKITQRVIDEINARHDEILCDSHKVITKMIALGEILCKTKARLRHGRWGRWVDNNLKFTIRTATRYMKVYEQRYNPLLADPDAFLRHIYGNEPKAVNDTNSDVGSDVNVRSESADADLKQSGGDGLNFGEEKENIFADKGRPAIANFKQLVAMLDREFFQSSEITRAAKLEFIAELINWLENQKKNLRS